MLIPYVEGWKQEVMNAPGKAAEKKKMFLSDPTYKGLIMTGD